MARHALYDGGVTIDFDGRKHMYTWVEKGYAIPGVTSVLKRLNKEALIAWAAKMAVEGVLMEIVPKLRGHVSAEVFGALLSVKEREGFFLSYTPDFLRETALPDMTLGELDVVCQRAKGHHARYTREAAGIGKQVHGYAEACLRATMKGASGAFPSRPDTKDERIHLGCDAFDEWIRAHDVRIIEPERVIFSEQYFYAGTADVYGYIDGELVVGDFKTSSGIWNEHLLQTAAYQNALEEELSKRIEARWLIRLDKKTGEFHAERYARNDLHTSAFLALLDVHRLMSKIEAQQK